MIEYAFSRLCFKADIIEQLNDNDEFAVHTLFGVFQMSKAEFYETFPNIVKTESYQKNRVYSMKNPTKKALRFLTNAKPNMNLQVNFIKPIKDLIGNEIREKIREIGVLWRNSEYNPQINNEVLNHWKSVQRTFQEICQSLKYVCSSKRNRRYGMSSCTVRNTTSVSISK